jgi:hypothetical protein
MLTWKRRFFDSQSNFDLILLKPEALDAGRMHSLLKGIVQHKFRRLTLNRRAIKEFQRFFDHPETPLKSDAYVLLSNWFLTGSGDRNSDVATSCEALWDELFSRRPLNRLSSPVAGRNHIALVSEFESFWARLAKAQAENSDRSGPHEEAGFDASNTLDDEGQQSSSDTVPEPLRADRYTINRDDQVRVTFEKDGLRYEVEGSPNAMAEFIGHQLNKPHQQDRSGS